MDALNTCVMRKTCGVVCITRQAQALTLPAGNAGDARLLAFTNKKGGNPFGAPPLFIPVRKTYSAAAFFGWTSAM